MNVSAMTTISGSATGRGRQRRTGTGGRLPSARPATAAPRRASRGAREPSASSPWACPAIRVAMGTPRARCRWASDSTLRRATSTWAGHSDAHALQPRQSSRASCSSSSARPPSRRPSRAARSRTARPRVEWRSSPSAWKLGHIAPPRARQAPLPLHASPARASPPSRAKLIAVRRGRRGGEASRRRPSSSGSAATRTPGLRIRPGSRAAFRRANAAMASGGYMRGRSSLRSRPSPCSPESDPPSRATRSATSSEMRRIAARAPGRRQVEERADVQAADARVPEPDGGHALAREHGAHRAREPGEPLRRHRGVLDERQRPRVAVRAARRAHGAGDPGAAHRPDQGLRGSVRDDPRARDRRETAGHVVRVAAVLHDQQRRGLGREPHQGPHRRRPVGRVEQGAVHQLDRRRPRLEQAEDGLERGVDRVERHQGEAPGGRLLHEAQLRAACHGEGPLRPAEHPWPVRVVARERVERVAGHPAHQARRTERPRRAVARPRARAAAGSRARSVARVPSASVTSSARTWSAVRPYTTDRAPAELLATIPPSVARLSVATSGPKARPCPAAAAFRSSSTTPGPTRAVRRVGVDLHAPERRAVHHQPGAHGLARQAGARRRASSAAPRASRHASTAASRSPLVAARGGSRPGSRRYMLASHAYSSREAAVVAHLAGRRAAQSWRPVRAPSMRRMVRSFLHTAAGHPAAAGCACGPGVVC